jgi:hypothetical protein
MLANMELYKKLSFNLVSPVRIVKITAALSHATNIPIAII